jgi:hypothetical protein
MFYRLAKEKLKVSRKNVDNNDDEDMHTKYLKLKLEKIISKFDEFILENNEIENCKCKLQSCIQNLDFLLYISVECLYHRETRSS